MGLTHSPNALLEQRAPGHSVAGHRFPVLFVQGGPLPFGRARTPAPTHSLPQKPLRGRVMWMRLSWRPRDGPAAPFFTAAPQTHGHLFTQTLGPDCQRAPLGFTLRFSVGWVFSHRRQSRKCPNYSWVCVRKFLGCHRA